MATAELVLEVHARTGRAYVAYVRKHLVAAHAMLRAPLAEMSLALVGDRRMADLHERFMGIAGPTDVLTFELDHDARGRVVAGEVVVCVPYAVRAARRSGVAVRKEVLLYALHGMLHLCGFDDRTDRDFALMHEREDDILTRLGVGKVFAREMAGKKRGTVGATAKRRRGGGQ
ncbi:MAG: putative rRNA maturation factor [Phycisphaerales bacterium]|nr:putative rRNA maturation factor [Phycisphaerales bacterium]